METIRLDLVEMIGWRYVIEHCISSFLKLQEERAYRTYVTDALMLISENTANISNGKYMNKHFSDIYEKGEQKEEKKPTAEEVKEKIKSKFRKKGGGK